MNDKRVVHNKIIGCLALCPEPETNTLFRLVVSKLRLPPPQTFWGGVKGANLYGSLWPSHWMKSWTNLYLRSCQRIVYFHRLGDHGIHVLGASALETLVRTMPWQLLRLRWYTNMSDLFKYSHFLICFRRLDMKQLHDLQCRRTILRTQDKLRIIYIKRNKSSSPKQRL